MICTFCQKDFQRSYRISAARAARPQFCSKACYGLHHAAKSAAAFAGKFWARLKPANERGCREWSGRTYFRYGLVDLANKPQMAHRVAYYLATGQEPGELDVCHTCDNPPCCTPEHLWLGTHLENMQDRTAKGRSNPPKLRGEAHGQAKLDAAAVRAIRASSERDSKLALQYGVTAANIYRVKARISWRHV
ncbi:HNH endonuclease signature motif containing protein [Bradyrhizobium sp.]|uniref:HNH endonuclease signature motif containing protein n=1 Tax=Bradyrhizobium sp. TaxID=376 RepID=UPI0025C49F16|nr:HNH endonuclease signature motif containing protein [Bradyrhizobium sp.]